MFSFDIPQMENEEFFLWQSMLERRTGLWLPETRKAFLVSSLNRHMREKEIVNYDDYYQMLDGGMVSSLDWAKLVDSLTVHETCFYRDKESIQLVNSYCRNKILNEIREKPNKQPAIQLWSVGCSTGEETYTLALEMEKLKSSFKESSGKDLYYGVTGIDVSYPSLAIAREGIYTDKHLDFVPNTTANSFFERLSDGHSRISKKIRKRTCFVQSNILDLEAGFKQSFDLIYCQNVMIYFKAEKKESVIESLAKRLLPGGLLVLGHGEITSTQIPSLTRVDNKQCLAFIKN